MIYVFEFARGGITKFPERKTRAVIKRSSQEKRQPGADMSSALFHKPMFETRLLASENASVAACFETKNADTLDTVVTMRMTQARK